MNSRVFEKVQQQYSPNNPFYNDFVNNIVENRKPTFSKMLKNRIMKLKTMTKKNHKYKSPKSSMKSRKHNKSVRK